MRQKKGIAMQRIKKILLNGLIHLSIAWILITLFSLIPYLYRVNTHGDYIFNTDGSAVTAWQYMQFSIAGFPFLIPFLFLIEFSYQYLFKRTRLLRFALICLLIAAFSFLLPVLFRSSDFQFKDLLSGIEPVLFGGGYALLYAVIRDYFYQYKRRRELLRQQSENELNALKAQLNPHFLFNTLNYLYGNALKEEAAITAEGIDKLSEMMRYTIMGMHQDFVPLEKELAFIDNYLSLQRVRLPSLDNILIDIQINSTQNKFEIAPLLLLPFIENAFKYGISVDQPCSIHMRIEEKDGSLIMRVHNLIMMNHAEVKGNNTGIMNTIKRLKLLYPNGYKLEYGDHGNEYEVLLSIKLNKNIMNMLALFIGMLIPFVSFSMNDSDSTSTVKIDMGSLNKMAKVYLLYQIEGEMIIDSADYKDGYHTFTNKINRPLYATLVADPDRIGVSGLKKKNDADVDVLRLYIHPGLIVTKTDRFLANAVFEVSDVNLDDRRLKAMLKQTEDQRSIVNQQIAQATESQVSKQLLKQRDSLAFEKRLVLEKFINENPNSTIALFALFEYGGIDLDLKVVESMYNRLSEKIRSTILGKEFYRLMENKKNLVVGSIAPEFTQNDTLGRPVSLSSFKGKYVLLDFWASWCGPCREENPNLRSIYKDFKDRNFTILGISLDAAGRRDAWLQAIMDDELTWTQVSDLKQWENQVAKLYSIRAIPQSFLINPDGIIIAKGLNSKELRIILEKELADK